MTVKTWPKTTRPTGHRLRAIALAVGAAALAACSTATAPDEPAAISPVGLASGSPAPAPTAPAGLYGLTKGHDPIPANILRHPDLTGVVVRGSWSRVETAPEVYDWSYFENAIREVGAAGRVASMAITTGGLVTPPWLQGEPIEWFGFEDTNQFHRDTFGTVVRTPVFWDPRYLELKVRFIRAAGARLSDEPALKMVSAQCANAATDDWNMPSANDAHIAEWRRVGYSDEKLVAACIRILDETMAAFPNQVVRMAVGRVPPQLSDEPDGVSAALRAHADRRYPGRLVLQRHNLSARTNLPTAEVSDGWTWLYGQRPLIAAQQLWPTTDEQTCRMNGRQSPCQTLAMFTAMAERARAYRLRYLEVYSSDLQREELRVPVRQLAEALRGMAAQDAPPSSEAPVVADVGPGPQVGGLPPAAQNRPARGQGTRGGARPPRGQAGQAARPGQPPRSLERPWLWVNATPPERPVPAGVSHHTVASAVVGQDVGYNIYLPPSYSANPQRRYPVIYWLHGKGGNESRGAYVAGYLDEAIRARGTPEMIMVVVNGGAGSFYSDSYDGRFPVETFLIQELLPHIDATYRTLTDRANRHIEGFSMGGFGALKLAARYPEMFGSVATFGGAMLGREHPLGGQRDPFEFQLMFNNDQELFIRNSPGYWLEQNRDRILASGLAIRMVAGDADHTGNLNATMHGILERLGIAHEYIVVPGIEHQTPLYYGADEGGSFAFHAAAAAR